MKKSKYHQFLQRFNTRLRKEHSLRKDEFELSEILNNTFQDYLYSKRATIVIFLYTPLVLGILFLSIFFDIKEAQNAIILVSLIIILSFSLLSFYKLTHVPYFNRLRSRIELINRYNEPALNFDVEDICNKIESNNLFEEIKTKTAAQVYFEMKKSQTPESNYTNPEKLYLLYLFLNKELKIKTNDVEFRYIMGGLLGIQPSSLQGTQLTLLNELSLFIDDDEGLTKEKERKIRRVLKLLEEKRKNCTLFRDLKEKYYNPY